TGHNLLMNAAINGKNLLPLLNRNIFPLDAVDKMGRSALISAAAFGQTDAASSLLAALKQQGDSKLVAEVHRKDNAGFTSMQVAARNAKESTFDIFSEYLSSCPTPAQDVNEAERLAQGKLTTVPPGSPDHQAALN